MSSLCLTPFKWFPNTCNIKSKLLKVTPMVPSSPALFPCLIFPYFLPHSYTQTAPNPWISPWTHAFSGLWDFVLAFNSSHPSCRPSSLGQAPLTYLDSVQTSAPPGSSVHSPQTKLDSIPLCFNNIPKYYLLLFYIINNCLDVCYLK